MQDTAMSAIAEMGANLTALAVKGTVSAISARVRAIKMEKDAETIRNKYDEIVNELLAEREEAVRIAQVYKSEVERYEISDDDILYLHSTISKVLEILGEMNPSMPIDTFEQVEGLINVGTLKTMQLLGFNYKSAIGEPLTQVCAEAILSLSKAKGSQKAGAKGKK
jgi:archaellum component FlaC